MTSGLETTTIIRPDDAASLRLHGPDFTAITIYDGELSRAREWLYELLEPEFDPVASGFLAGLQLCVTPAPIWLKRPSLAALVTSYYDPFDYALKQELAGWVQNVALHGGSRQLADLLTLRHVADFAAGQQWLREQSLIEAVIEVARRLLSQPLPPIDDTGAVLLTVLQEQIPRSGWPAHDGVMPGDKLLLRAEDRMPANTRAYADCSLALKAGLIGELIEPVGTAGLRLTTRGVVALRLHTPG
jgi:hypothetical protein